jgi:hypothetical protein
MGLTGQIQYLAVMCLSKEGGADNEVSCEEDADIEVSCEED